MVRNFIRLFTAHQHSGLVSLVGGASAILIFLPSPAMAQSDNGWQINSFDSVISVQPNGVVRVDEHILADFGQTKHGIYRDIPVSYQAHGSTQPLYSKIDVTSVWRDGQSEPYELDQNDAWLRVKIGDPDKTIIGPHQYELIYDATGVLSAYPQYDELYWNVTGNGWGVPIAQATATVTLPKNGLVQFSCYEGVVGSVETCHASPKNGSTVQFGASRELQPSEGLTVAVGYTKGMVPILTAAAPKTWWQEMLQPWPVLSFMVAAIGSLSAVGWLYLKKGRDWWWRNPSQLATGQTAILQPIGGHDSVVVEYTPPDNLPPGMLGLIKDERADTLDVTSTIVDLAAKGYLVIKQLEKTWIFGSKDYELTRTEKPDDDLLAYEKLLLDRLFKSGNQVTLSSLKDAFYKDLAEVKDAMYQEAMRRQWFEHNPKISRGIYLTVAIAGLAGCYFGTQGLLKSQHYLLANVFIGLGIGFALLSALSFFMSQRTAQGHELYRRVKGYRLFIATAETYRQRFFERQNLFTQVLPYAMMFGLTEKFANAMKQIGYQPPAPAWYVGTGPFNPVVFGQDMGNVSKALSSTLAAAPSGSGSGGGGFSGGGFGGGGGGSW